MPRWWWVIMGGLAGAMLVALPAAAVWGSNGPSWPLAPCGVLALLGAFIGARHAD